MDRVEETLREQKERKLCQNCEWEKKSQLEEIEQFQFDINVDFVSYQFRRKVSPKKKTKMRIETVSE